MGKHPSLWGSLISYMKTEVLQMGVSALPTQVKPTIGLQLLALTRNIKLV
jgi:hypothetical protein